MAKHQTETNGPRADLAKAIESRDAAAKRVDELRASIERIEDERFDARQKLDAALAAQDADEADDGGEVIRRLIAGDTGAAVLTRPDRKVEADAERATDTCNRALAMLRPELVDAERGLELKTLRARDSAGAVIGAEALDAMISAAGRLQSELEARRSVLSFLHPLVPRDHKTKIERALASSPGPQPALDAWRAAVDSLMIDATAELPR